MEQLSYHVHAHLAMFNQGQPITLPPNIGIRTDCISWLHTHDATGVIHIEAPSPRTYSLGAFVHVWGQPLDSTHLVTEVADSQHEIRAFVNGQPYAGAPEDIPLEPHAVIVLELGPPFIPPPPYVFPAGE
jgi:hypothetical protein